jgi:hypothetical protein
MLVQCDVVTVLGCSHSVDVDCGADLFWNMLPVLQGEVAAYFAHLCSRIGERMFLKNLVNTTLFHMVPTPQNRNTIKSHQNEGLNQ